MWKTAGFSARPEDLPHLRRPMRPCSNNARAVGDAELLEQALVGLDETFLHLTGKKPTKSAGTMYAARTLIYQDCQRDVSVQLGTQAISTLGKPLSLLLTSARWFSYQTA